MCPAVKSPIVTTTCDELFKGNYDILIPSTGEKFITMIELLTYKSRYYPAKLMQSFVNLNFSLQRQDLLRKSKFYIFSLIGLYIFDLRPSFKLKCVFCLVLNCLITVDLKRYDFDLATKIGQITSRTLIIWGKNDELLHVSGAEQLAQTIKNSELRILDNCNHVIHMDQPVKTFRHIMAFIKGQDHQII